MTFLVSHRTCRIEICGGIASGKTTLASLLRSDEIQVTYEDFSSNPFWQAFYADPINTAFETEITFLLQHYHQIKTASNLVKTFLCDFSLLQDYAYANVTLEGSRLSTFEQVYREAGSHLSPPNLLIYLQCSPEVELERIRARGREAEKSITIDYLTSISNRLTTLISTLPPAQKVLAIDSGYYDFAHDSNTKILIVEQVLHQLAAT